MKKERIHLNTIEFYKKSRDVVDTMQKIISQVSDSDKERLEVLSKISGLSIAALIRNLILKEINEQELKYPDKFQKQKRQIKPHQEIDDFSNYQRFNSNIPGGYRN